MGLDFLDLTLRIEDAFGIALSDDDLEAVFRDGDVMVGDLYTVVLKKVHRRDTVRNDVRLNWAFWRQLRGIFCTVTEAPFEAIELRTPLAELFPRATRRAQWQALRDACPYRVAELGYPRFVRTAGFALAAGMVLVDQARIWRIPGAAWLWPVLGLVGVWMLAETYMRVLVFLRPFQVCFPAGMTTVKDLCRAVLSTNYDRLGQETAVPLDDRCIAVWERLTGILVDVLGVEAERVTFRSRLIRDLGMG